MKWPEGFAAELEMACTIEPDRYKAAYVATRCSTGKNGVEYRGCVWIIAHDHYAPGFTFGSSAKVFDQESGDDLDHFKRDSTDYARWAAQISLHPATST